MLWSHCGNKSMAQTHQASSFSPQRINSELAMKPLLSSLTICLRNFLLFKQHLKHFFSMLTKFAATHPNFKHFLFLVHTSSNILPQYQVMAETRDCCLLKPVLRPLKALWVDLRVYFFLWLLHIRGVFGWLELSSPSCALSPLGCFQCVLPLLWFLVKYMKVFSTLLHRIDMMPAKNHHKLVSVLKTHYQID